MSELYGPEHRVLHDRFETRRLADGVEQVSMHQELAEMDKKFITACDMFFLSTIDPLGWPTVSYKGGAPGTVKVVDDHHLVFPCYDGNGTFYSMGNTPDWKRVDQFQPLLSSHDRDAAEQAGLITAEEYRTTFWDGLD